MAILLKKVKLHVKIHITFSFLFLAACSSLTSPTTAQQPNLLSSPTSVVTPSATPFMPPANYVSYHTQSGDSLEVVARHFHVQPEQVISEQPIPSQGLIDVGQLLYLPRFNDKTTPSENLFPDSEVVYSPSVGNFNVPEYAKTIDGKLRRFVDALTRRSGAEVIQQWALEFSINPRLLLSLLELNGSWISGNPETREKSVYAFGYVKSDKGGLYDQTAWACQKLNAGYYGWRSGTLSELVFPDGTHLPLAPSLNAGTVAVMYYLSQFQLQSDWQASLIRLAQIHENLFGDYHARAAKVEPLLPSGLQQPQLSLPFPSNATWNYTCGPHTSWGEGDNPPLGALDFAPPTAQSGCANSVHWATAMAPGHILSRPVLSPGLVIQELDEDNNEHTGWVLYYMHIASTNRIQPGAKVETGDRIGHPSCEGGSSSGAHVHVFRMYNGEFIPAVGALPFVLSGYQAGLCERHCEGGTLVRGDVTVKSYPWGNYWTKICQPESERCTMGTPTPRPTLTPRFTQTPSSIFTPTRLP